MVEVGLIAKEKVMSNDNNPLHTKYRPDTFEKFIGNEATLEALKTVLRREVGIPPAFLFQGPAGCGKTTLARIVAKELGCSGPDLQEYNTANTRGIDTIREISMNCSYAPLGGKCRVYILDECHRQTVDAQNALLKLLEEPPKGVFFILCTTDPERMLKTIRSRCQVFQLGTLQRAKLRNLLTTVCESEGVTISETILVSIVKASEGSPRQALVLLDQIIDIENEEVALQAIVENKGDDTAVKDIIDILIATQPERWRRLGPVLRNFNQDPEQARQAVAGYLSVVLLSRSDDRLADILSSFLEPVTYTGRAGFIYACYLACKF